MGESGNQNYLRQSVATASHAVGDAVDKFIPMSSSSSFSGSHISALLGSEQRR